MSIPSVSGTKLCGGRWMSVAGRRTWLLMIALCTVLCGGQGAVDMALFAKAKEQFLRGFLKLKTLQQLTMRSAGCSGRSIQYSSVKLPARTGALKTGCTGGLMSS